MFDGLIPGYDLIMIDPPWKFIVRSAKGLGRSAERHYETMTLEEIKALPVYDLGARNCLLWMWATAPMLKLQIEVMQAWGFEFKTCGTWIKTVKDNSRPGWGTGYLLRNAHEHFLIGTKGQCERVTNVRSVIMSPRREHSRKPDEAYICAERMRPLVTKPRRLDLFSRQVRKGWDSWGNETMKFGEKDDGYATTCEDRM